MAAFSIKGGILNLLHTLFLALVLAVLPVAAHAQAFPNKPVKVIVTFPPGGTPDIYGRVLSQELSNLWKQPVVVENKAGASGTIGTDFVAKAAPDGYTLLFAADASITIAPLLYSRNPYDPVKDLAPIVNAAAGPFVILANSSFPANNVKELIALAKSQPGKISYASSGGGGQQHLTMETIKSMGDIDMLHIPYKGFGQGVTDVLANQVPLIVGGITASIGLTQSRRHAARDYRQDPRRRGDHYQASGFPGPSCKRRHRPGGQHPRTIRRPDQGRHRHVDKNRKGRRGKTRLGISCRISLFCVAPEVGGEQAGSLFRGGGCNPGHHVEHQRPHIAFALHAHHHAIENYRPLGRVMHRRIGQVVALHAILHHHLRTG
ncbi:MAG: tripartite tricarboxylate transporter substrate-binding protein [Proteobacteria bacterium]|nr:tripartite tricarboxylate transporter substrate-binding protein [Pseudomonadota bacterium]